MPVKKHLDGSEFTSSPPRTLAVRCSKVRRPQVATNRRLHAWITPSVRFRFVLETHDPIDHSENSKSRKEQDSTPSDSLETAVRDLPHLRQETKTGRLCRCCSRAR